MTFAPPHAAGTPESSSMSIGAMLTWVIASPVRVAVIAAAAVLAVDAGGTDDGAGVCIFRRASGAYCPGCGLTRSARHLTRGQVGAAWNDHPWLVLVAVQAVLAGVVYAAATRARAHLRRPRNIAIVASINGALLLVVWIVRLADGSIPRFF